MASRKHREERPIERVRTLHARGDVRGARELASSIVGDAAAAPEDREEAAGYRARTEVDRRAVGVGLAALAVGVFVVVVFILLRHG